MTHLVAPDTVRATEPASLAVRLLGSFEVRLDGAPVLVPSGGQRLVAMLALHGRAGRSALAGSLWPETTQHRALANLRTSIWRANQAVPGIVEATGGQVGLQAGVEVDVTRLVASARRLLDWTAGSPSPDLLSPLDEGDLLPDWEDEWLAVDRERLRQLRLHMFEATALRLSKVGCYGLALESALAALRVDPLRESAYRCIIGIHLEEGNVGEARRVYAECVSVLQRDLGVAPSFTMSHPPVPPRESSWTTAVLHGV